MKFINCSCGGNAIYFRRYEGRYYCKNCFINQIEKRFLKTVSENSLIGKGEKIAVGVSGGKDSSTLLYLMKKFFGDIDISAISVDEGISGYRDESIRKAEEFCKSISVEHHTVSFKDKLGFRLDDIKTDNFCTHCGVFRRYLLNKKARELGADKMAVAHNMDDEVQSILMNIFRGDLSKFRRLGAKPPSVGDEKLLPRIKPLRDIPEKEVKLYAILNSIPYYDGECPHSLNNVRRDVQKIINDTEERYAGTKHQIISFYDKISPAIGSGIPIQKVLDRCKICGEAATGGICRACQLVENITGKVKGIAE